MEASRVSTQIEPKTLAKDALFNALRLAIPGATHDQLLAIIRAVDRYVAIYIQEYEAR